MADLVALYRCAAHPHPCRQYVRGTGGVLADDMGLGEGSLPFARGLPPALLVPAAVIERCAATCYLCWLLCGCRQDDPSDRLHCRAAEQDGRPQRRVLT